MRFALRHPVVYLLQVLMDIWDIFMKEIGIIFGYGERGFFACFVIDRVGGFLV